MTKFQRQVNAGQISIANIHQKKSNFFVLSNIQKLPKPLKSQFFLLSIVFKGFLIRGGSRGTILFISFGMKFDIIFKNILVSVRTRSWIRCGIMIIKNHRFIIQGIFGGLRGFITNTGGCDSGCDVTAKPASARKRSVHSVGG